MDTYFRFQVKQTVSVLLYKIKMGGENLGKRGKRWEIQGSPEIGILSLHAVNRPEVSSTISINPACNEMIIDTPHGYQYTITNNPDKDGAIVIFHGPLNALLMQDLMPKMAYVPNTLVARNDRFSEFVSIDAFMNERISRHSNKPNPQDEFGWKINAKFNNEITGLPEFWPLQRQARIAPKKARKNKTGKFSRKSG